MTLKHWTPRPDPGAATLRGARVTLEPLDWCRHGEGLFAAVAGPDNLPIWRYMPNGPYETRDDFEREWNEISAALNWQTLVICRAGDGACLGMSSYMRIRKAHGSAEIGAVAFGDALKRTPEATEAMYLMAAHLFDDLGYRRYEWKCHNDNAASKRAALRLGFRFEGIFRNDMVVRGQSRDTAWYAMTDGDWPEIKSALQSWLSLGNFGEDGTQRRSLSDIRRPA